MKLFNKDWMKFRYNIMKKLLLLFLIFFTGCQCNNNDAKWSKNNYNNHYEKKENHIEHKPRQVSEEEKVLLLINKERRFPLLINESLQNVARKQANYMAKSGRMSHYEGFWGLETRMKKYSNESWRGYAENVAYGQDDANEVVDAWMHSKGHRENILGNYDYCGIAVAEKNSTKYWCIVFGKK